MPDALHRPDPGLGLLLLPKWLTARARTMSNQRGRGARFTLLGLIGLLFWLFIYTVLYKLLVYFRGVPDEPRPVPSGLMVGRVNAQTGLLAKPDDPAAITEYFLTGKLPPAGAAPGTPTNSGSEPLF